MKLHILHPPPPLNWVPREEGADDYPICPSGVRCQSLTHGRTFKNGNDNDGTRDWGTRRR